METLITSPHEFLIIILLLAGVGICAGVIAGMFGIGGGVVIVPALYYLAPLIGFEGAREMQVIMGTTLATIIFTGLSASYSHLKYKEVSWEVIRKWTPAMFIGSFAGAYLNTLVKGDVLTALFAGFCILIGLKMFFGVNTKAHFKSLPSFWSNQGISGFIGAFSAMMGVGGGTLTVPALTFFSYPIKKASGTASFLGSVVALSGSISYVISGWNIPDLPPYSFGYINWLALLLIVPATMLCAPLGTLLAHKLSDTFLNKLFAVILWTSSARMLYDIIF